ncbi:MAG: T9SS type A sorting domain-containing protein [Candidatus Marinimicrobia bacterium]|nr:T9SS type A sorting domain-containing protein [Candidatus Neomarinimicrobiota bacterium]
MISCVYFVKLIPGDYTPTPLPKASLWDNPTTTIEFSIPVSELVTLTVYDNLGREIETILNQKINVGTHYIQWDATNVTTSIYFVRMESGEFSQTRKVVVLK